jgi:hypothetical protein
MRILSSLHSGVWLFLFLGLFQCPRSAACGCVGTENLSQYELIKQSVDRADSVFLGIPRLLHGDGKSDDTQDLVVFDVLQVFKGKQGTRISVHSGVGITEMNSCGYSFKVEKTYLVFANSYDGSQLAVAACSYTALAERSGTALRFLRKEPPQPDDLLTPAQMERSSKGRILGAIRRADSVRLFQPEVYIWSDSDSSYEKPGWPIDEEWPGDKDGSLKAFLLARFTSTDKDGSFASDFLVPGTYRITAVDPSYGPTRWVGAFFADADDPSLGKAQVFAGRDYRWVDIVLHEQKVFSLQGFIRSSDGSPLPIKGVTIRATMAPGEMFPLLEYVYPNSEGLFIIERAPVGTVRLAIYVPQYIDPNWEPSIKDVEVKGDTKQIEIVLTRKAGPPAPTPPELDEGADSTPD